MTFDEKEFNEAGQTREVVQRFGTNHREVRVTRAQFVAELPRIHRRRWTSRPTTA